MIRLLAVGCFGLGLLLNASCESDSALTTCQMELHKAQNTSSTQLSSLEAVKTELNEAKTKIQQLTKENDDVKAKEAAGGKPTGKAVSNAKFGLKKK